ncbi:MAG: phosphoribosylglycinamide formyltransferase [Candidatus Eisenbacteria bacterium]|uniref:Phosphoribosylglycinamide formyltransferase n=1 Tax=Eiseniibacteriota bacterium TaxID=2212470 RepID=A0A948RVL1_UNCEI|nr:phosphoribosylglycinamide formyltransferase [Candidatus Eisenbacteria bacterium]MBU1947585.1 phosphoribosylglycinamide formyltransferase [Candidatus Eisenbacteria bacterium]MBU2690287.1 phosphoribosylglycinamide formyltransferase [Candidatus Eisenbacteria bacterium]
MEPRPISQRESHISSGEKFRVAVLISGGGTNLQALLDAATVGSIAAEVCLVISSNPEAVGLERAKRAGVPTAVFRSKDFPDLPSFRRALLESLRDSGARLLVLAGYMKKLPREVLRAYPDAIINIHPALLPRFGGKGYFGRRVHAAVLAAGERVSGATVHLVTEGYDEGPNLLQEQIPVRSDDTVESLAARVLAVEHRLLPAAVQAFADGRVRSQGGRVWVEPA